MGPVLQNIIILLAGIVLGLLGLWIAWRKPSPDSSTAWLYQAAVIAVKAAEQLYKSQQIQDRKAAALERLQALLDDRGLGGIFSATAIDAAIEAAVHDLRPRGEDAERLQQ